MKTWMLIPALVFPLLAHAEIEISDETVLTNQLREAPPSSTLVLSGPRSYKIDKNISVRSDLSLIFQNGAVLEPSAGVTIELNGPLQAGLFQIFGGAGRVKLGDGAAAQVYPQWWGARADGTRTEETTRALQAALDSGLKVFLPRGVYSSYHLQLKQDGLVLEGANREKSILRFMGKKGSFLELQGSFVKLADFTVEGTARDYSSSTAGVHFFNSSRSKIDNLRIGGFGYGVQITKFGGNNINHCYIYANRRAGIYMAGGAHGVSITGGTEIADAPYGIVLGQFRDSPWQLEHDDTGVVGQMVSVSGAVIEGIHAVGNGVCKDCMGGVGIYSSMGQKGISVTGTYFELMKAALQLGSAFKNDGKTAHTTAVLNVTFRDNFLAGVDSVVRVGRVSYGDISNNHCSGVKHMFDTSGAGLFQYVKVDTNFNCGKLTSKPFSANFGK